MTAGAESLLMDGRFMETHGPECSYLFGRFMVEHLVRVNRMFDGDLTTAIVLGTIGQHNARRFYEEVVTKSDEPMVAIIARGGHRDMLRPCNTLSISSSSGIPRETVRRKVRWLMDRGLVVKVGRNGLMMHPDIGSRFREFDTVTMDRFAAFLEQVARIPERCRPKAPAVHAAAGAMRRR